MTAEQIETLRHSWLLVSSQLPELTEACYARLFERDPSLRQMFASDMRAQQGKLADTLASIVEHADRPEQVADQLQALGMRHLGYGVREEHYGALEWALLAALRDSLGDAFDEPAESAWKLAFAAIAQAMQSADIDDAMFPM